MRKLVWLFGWTGVAVWSLVCAAAYGLVDVVGSLAMRNADVFSSDPSTVEWIWRVLSGLHSLSTSVILVVWGLVCLAILAVPWLFDRALSNPAAVMRGVRFGPLAEPHRPPEDGVIDLSPDQYSVRPSEPARSPASRAGPAPRITPRS